ncbi:DUF1816 domain-containing protein (plasmid) [Acaryochloris sp. 'Moss Beach']|uniref:DUF1816 domain-containing protein n=1 Tax=Acaryochloris TaxID=155977 RepID=UPI001BB0D276|nr:MULTISPECIES: DUF1816 domain-containing protein [Acaryochloris]QUY45920.1 DUF1816 domain-containing protein [Acaryochloris marina S15]UJB72488.1 DUF1816 domain-containing protein [Acaryochloris sp. 'Moss Beach']
MKEQQNITGRIIALLSNIAGLVNYLGLAWWAEINTSCPTCTYYFGPFISRQEVEVALPGYIEDLESEQAENIVTNIQRCKPAQLTNCYFDDSQNLQTFELQS